MISMETVNSKSPPNESFEKSSSEPSSPPKTFGRYSLEKPMFHSIVDEVASSTMNLTIGTTGIVQSLEENLSNLQSPDIAIRTSGVESILAILSNPDNESLLKSYLNNIITLANQCPFPEISKPFRQFLNSISDKYYISKERTTLFSNEKVVDIDTEDELTKRLFQEIFLRDGKVSHLVRVLGWHPSYLEKFIMVYNNVMRDPGPVPLAWRNYIGIMASARYSCQYVVSFQEREFLLNNGDPKWLAGIDHIPQKLKNLVKVVELMAHQPWLLPKLDIEYLVKGPDAWSIAELVHAMVLICTFLSLSGLVFCCGITPELPKTDSCISSLLNQQQSNSNTGGSSGFNILSQSFDSSDGDVEDNSALEDTEKVMELLKKRKNSAEEDEDDDSIDSNLSRQQSFHNAGIESENNSVGYQSPQQPYNPSCDQGKRSTSPYPSGGNPTGNNSSSLSSTAINSNSAILNNSNILAGDLSRYIGAYQLSHQDFDVSSREYSTFSVQEYSWKDHGYELISRYFPDAAPLLDEEFELVFSMTYYKFNDNPDIDTQPFRRAIWYYVQRVKGMCHDDYNYKEVNDFLTKNLKYFVKKAVCFPQKITKSDYSTLGYNLTPDEKCHVSLLAVCSHKQASLLYGLYTVMSYQNRR